MSVIAGPRLLERPHHRQGPHAEDRVSDRRPEALQGLHSSGFNAIIKRFFFVADDPDK
jgi:hypothetical protein